MHYLLRQQGSRAHNPNARLAPPRARRPRQKHGAKVAKVKISEGAAARSGALLFSWRRGLALASQR
eukprot:14209406-Heterocapsa_arctica.AAC.1